MPARTLMPLEDYLRTSFDSPDREFRDGEVVERGSPTYPHAKARMNLGYVFRSYRDRLSVYPASELRLRLSDQTVRIADLAVFREEPSEPAPTHPPYIVAEILSPDDRMRDVMDRLADLAAWGVPHVWLIDPAVRKLYVYGGGLREVPFLDLPELPLRIPPEAVFD